MRSALQSRHPLNRCLPGACVCREVPPAIHTVPIPVLQPSNLKAFNVFHFNHLPPLCVSLPSFFARRPVFSTTSSLFLQNTRGWGYLRAPRFWNQQHPAFPCTQLQRAIAAPVSCFVPSFVFRISSFVSRFALCFHNLTNPFSRNSRVFTSIQNPGGVPSNSRSPRQLSDYSLPTTHYSLQLSDYPLPTTHFPP
jgi:hypothetical protein